MATVKVVDMTHYVSNQLKYLAQDVESNKFGPIWSDKTVTIQITINKNTVKLQ